MKKAKKGVRFGGFNSENLNQIGGFPQKWLLGILLFFDLKIIYNSEPSGPSIFCSNGYSPYLKRLIPFLVFII